MLRQKNNKEFVKKVYIWSKNKGIAHTKTALAAKVANFFEMFFCFGWWKDQLKIYKITFLSSQALREK